jgi:diacylglycerol kinase
MVGMAKDISAGAVLAATTIAIIIGILLFGSAILDLF